MKLNESKLFDFGDTDEVLWARDVVSKLNAAKDVPVYEAAARAELDQRVGNIMTAVEADWIHKDTAAVIIAAQRTHYYEVPRIADSESTPLEVAEEL